MPLLGRELAALDPAIAGVQTTREPGDNALQFSDRHRWLSSTC